ncbi:MAG: nucleotidyl transferase AbiEii/AbiGii toxin family protein [Enterococcus hulanensis]
MKNFLLLKQSDRLAAIQLVSAELKISPVIIEKDLWVTYILNELFHFGKYKDSFVFKGGTSLSKAYGIIQRFSEDIDLVLDWRKLGYADNTPWEDRSNRQQGLFNNEANEKAAKWINDTLKPDLEKIVSEDISDFEFSIKENDPQTLMFRYPSIIASDLTGIEKSILLEIGPLAATIPKKDLNIISYVEEQYPQFFEDESNIIPVVTAERTFWEKATILHAEAHRINSNVPARYSRHYYDLYQLSKTPIKDLAIKNVDLLTQVVKFKKKFYPSNRAEYDLATPATILLNPPKGQLDRLYKDYEAMQDMIFGERVSFDDILKGIEALEKEIHRIE